MNLQIIMDVVVVVRERNINGVSYKE